MIASSLRRRKAAGTAGANDWHLAGCNADVPSSRVVVVVVGGALLSAQTAPYKNKLSAEMYMLL